MNNPMKHKSWLAIAVVVVLGALLGWAILQKDKPKAHDEHGHAEHAEAEGHADDKEHGDEEHHEDAAEAKPAKGPHGGRLFNAGAYGLEVTIFETDVPPEFRLYTYQNGKPLAPGQTTAKLTLERLGREPQVIQFKPQGEFLRGDAEVVEPHSFKVTVEAVQGEIGR